MGRGRGSLLIKKEIRGEVHTISSGLHARSGGPLTHHGILIKISKAQRRPFRKCVCDTKLTYHMQRLYCSKRICITSCQRMDKPGIQPGSGLRINVCRIGFLNQRTGTNDKISRSGCSDHGGEALCRRRYLDFPWPVYKMSLVRVGVVAL